MDATPNRTDGRPRRWRPRFSLRSLLILMTALAVWLGIYLGRARNERLAAEAVVAVGGVVKYERPPGEGRPAWLRRLLGAHFFDRVVRVELHYSHQSRDAPFDEIIQRLPSLGRLQELSLRDIALRDADYRALGRLGHLEQLTLMTKVTLSEQNAAELASLAAIRELYLPKTPITAPALAEIAKLPRLEMLSVGALPSYLSLESRADEAAKLRLNDAAARAIAGCASLRALVLQETVITDEGASELSRLANLTSLSISSPNLTGKALQELKRLDKIDWLGIQQWRIDDEDLEALSEMPNLTGMTLLTSPRTTDRSLAYLAGLRQLERLSITCSDDFTGVGLNHFWGLSNLRTLNLFGPKGDELNDNVKRLQLALPMCRVNFIAR